MLHEEEYKKKTTMTCYEIFKTTVTWHFFQNQTVNFAITSTEIHRVLQHPLWKYKISTLLCWKKQKQNNTEVKSHALRRHEHQEITYNLINPLVLNASEIIKNLFLMILVPFSEQVLQCCHGLPCSPYLIPGLASGM